MLLINHLLRHPWKKERGAIFYSVPDTTRDIIVMSYSRRSECPAAVHSDRGQEKSTRSWVPVHEGFAGEERSLQARQGTGGCL
jgi:hypothetical protein